jgi:hypothetical protein
MSAPIAYLHETDVENRGAVVGFVRGRSSSVGARNTNRISKEIESCNSTVR